MTDNYGHVQPSRCKTCKELAEDCECKRDRLLSKQRVRDILDSNANPIEGRKALLAAQLAKTDKEWVEWIERQEVGSVTNPGWKSISPDEWQSRRKEIGL